MIHSSKYQFKSCTASGVTPESGDICFKIISAEYSIVYKQCYVAEYLGQNQALFWEYKNRLIARVINRLPNNLLENILLAFALAIDVMAHIKSL